MLWTILISISVFASSALGSTIVSFSSHKTVFNEKESLFNNCKLAKKSAEGDLKSSCDRLGGTLLDVEFDATLNGNQRSLCNFKAKGRCETAL